MPSSRPGTSMSPPKIDRNASIDMATFIGISRSAMWCSGPGKPISVSSLSPLAGLKGSAWARCPSSSSFASCVGLAGADAEDDPERVEGRQDRGDVAADREDQ